MEIGMKVEIYPIPIQEFWDIGANWKFLATEVTTEREVHIAHCIRAHHLGGSRGMLPQKILVLSGLLSEV